MISSRPLLYTALLVAWNVTIMLAGEQGHYSGLQVCGTLLSMLLESNWPEDLFRGVHNKHLNYRERPKKKVAANTDKMLLATVDRQQDIGGGIISSLVATQTQASVVQLIFKNAGNEKNAA